jgi:hypothetical protein
VYVVAEGYLAGWSVSSVGRSVPTKPQSVGATDEVCSSTESRRTVGLGRVCRELSKLRQPELGMTTCIINRLCALLC